MGFWTRLKTTLLGREEARERAEDEAAFHLEMREEELLRRGVAPGDAARMARAAYGNVARMQETAGDVDVVVWLEGLMRDLRVAARRLMRSPVFVVSSVVLMTIGLGVNAAVFSVMDALFLRPLPFAQADRLVVIEERREGRVANSNPGRLADWRERVKSFEAVASNYGEVERGVVVMRVAGDWPGLLRVGMIEGRGFTAEELRGGAVALLTEKGRQLAKLGEVVRLGSQSVQVIGVVPQTVALDGETEVLVPMSAAMQRGSRKAGYLSGVARLREGVSREAAEAEVASVAAELARAYPETDRGMTVRLVDAQKAWTEEARRPALYVQAAAGLLLCIALVNLAGLLAARAMARSHEDRVRLSLGAGPWHLLRLHLTEAGLVVALGVVGAIAVAPMALSVLQALYAADFPLILMAQVDVRVLGALLVVAVLSAGVCAGVMAGRGFSFRNVLVVGEAAIGVVLLAVALQLVQDFSRLRFAPLGIREMGLVSARAYLPWSTDADEVRRVIDQGREQLAALPGVVDVAVVDRLPLEGGSQDSPVFVDRQAEKTRETVGIRMGTRNSFAVLGIPVLAGEVSTDENTVVVNETFARRYLNGAAVGRRVSQDGKRWWRVAGVVGDVRYSSKEAVPRPEVFFGERSQYWPMLTFVAKTSQPVGQLAPGVRKVLGTVAPGADLRGVSSVAGRIDEIVAEPRKQRDVVGVFGVVALVLVLAGVYGVMASEMLRRRKEFGIRAAVGASSARLLGVGLGRALRLGACAVALGGVVVLFDSWVGLGAWAAAAGVVMLGMVLAALGPAWRSAHVDPMDALRWEKS